jgi:hypothetical protein
MPIEASYHLTLLKIAFVKKKKKTPKIMRWQ